MAQYENSIMLWETHEIVDVGRSVMFIVHKVNKQCKIISVVVRIIRESIP